jgi:hypothetical protein
MRALAFVVALAGCGTPGIMEMRTQQLPARARECALAWLPQVPDESTSLVGTLTIVRDVPVGDPIGSTARALIGPRACAMGGSTVALFTQSIVDGRPLAATYLVLAPASERAR